MNMLKKAPWSAPAISLCVLTLLAGCASVKVDVESERGPNVEVVADSKPTAPQLRWVQDEPAYLAKDLKEIQARGELRVLVHGLGSPSVPRLGSPRAVELSRVETLARVLGVRARLVAVGERSELLTSLLDGRGDIVASRLTITPDRERRVLMSRPIRFIEENVIVSKKRKKKPGSLQDLTESGITVRASSSFHEMLSQEELVQTGALKIHPMSESIDTLDGLAAVGRGEIEATVCDSHALASYQTYRDDVAVAFPYRRDVPIGWAIRPGSNELVKAINTFISTQLVADHDVAHQGGDLKAIKNRGVLRVAMPNDSNAFYFHDGHPSGRQYELVNLLAQQMGVRLELIVPRAQEDLMEMVLARRVDLVAPWLSITPERAKRVRFSLPMMRVDEVLIQRESDTPIFDPADLNGREIHVRKGSSYREHIETLREKAPNMKVVEVAEGIETSELVAKVASGEVDLTIADYDILSIAMANGYKVRDSLLIGHHKSRAFALHPDAMELLATVDRFCLAHPLNQDPSLSSPAPTAGDSVSQIASARFPDWRRAIKRTPSSILKTAERVCAGTSLDPHLLVAQSAVGSGHKRKRVGWSGGRGLLQMRPHTARKLGFSEQALESLGSSLRIGRDYMLRILADLPSSIPKQDRILMALAGFRLGPEHLNDARSLAHDQGLPTDKWKGGVRKALRLLERPEFASRARYGFAPASDAVVYAERVLEAMEAIGK